MRIILCLQQSTLDRYDALHIRAFGTRQDKGIQSRKGMDEEYNTNTNKSPLYTSNKAATPLLREKQLDCRPFTSLPHTN